jgi:hypothetical protein
VGDAHDEVTLVARQAGLITVEPEVRRDPHRFAFARTPRRSRAGSSRRGFQRQGVKEPDGAHPRQERMKSVVASRPDAQVQIDFRRRQQPHRDTVPPAPAI